MKTQTFGRYAVPFSVSALYPVGNLLSYGDYKKNRFNGTQEDLKKNDPPYDGKITWIKGRVEGDRVHGVRHAQGKYEYECRYDEGPGDRAWMEERDKNYVFRLLREGVLDRDEPNLAQEVPALYADVVYAKQLLAREAAYHATPLKAGLDDTHTVDVRTLPDQITKQYEQIRQNALEDKKEEIVTRLPPLKPLNIDIDLSQLPGILLQALVINQSVKTLILANTDLSTNAAALAELLRANKTITALNLTNTGLTNEAAYTLLEALKQNQIITALNLTNTGLTDETARLLLEVLKTNPNSKLVDLDVRENAIRRSLIIRLRIQLQHNAARLSTSENIVNAVIHSDDIQAEIRPVSPSEQQPGQQRPIPPIPEELEMLEVYRCASCNKIMINPVIAADGWTYESEEIERWFENHDTSPKTGEVLPHKHLIPNLAIQREIARFMQAHPELWLTDEMYTSENLRQELIRAVQGQDAPTVEHIVKQDRRLLTRILEEDRDLLLLALTSNPEVLQKVITELGEDKFWELPEIVRDDGAGCFRLAAELDTACARVMYTALGWQQREIQEQFEFAISNNNLRLAEVCLNLGANLEAINAQGLRPLHRVISASRYDLLRLFITQAIEINAVETPEARNTALHLAVIKRDQIAVEILLET